jgi:hypothetical protein
MKTENFSLCGRKSLTYRKYRGEYLDPRERK